MAAIVAAIHTGKGAAPTRADVLTNVARTQNFPTPVGSISFDTYGDTTAPILSLYEVKNDKPAFLGQIDLKLVARSRRSANVIGAVRNRRRPISDLAGPR
jgi:hypothetical protein